MSNQFQYIASLCKNIKNNGKTPSVGLIKKAANRPLPLKDIIDVMKRWQDDPEQFPSTQIDEQGVEKPKDLSSHVESLEKRIAVLEQQVKTLLQA